ncbi:MAG: RNA degradosome polyphosphate kinase [Streptosporangiaceae bacterium]
MLNRDQSEHPVGQLQPVPRTGAAQAGDLVQGGAGPRAARLGFAAAERTLIGGTDRERDAEAARLADAGHGAADASGASQGTAKASAAQETTTRDTTDGRRRPASPKATGQSARRTKSDAKDGNGSKSRAAQHARAAARARTRVAERERQAAGEANNRDSGAAAAASTHASAGRDQAAQDQAARDQAGRGHVAQGKAALNGPGTQARAGRGDELQQLAQAERQAAAERDRKAAERGRQAAARRLAPASHGDRADAARSAAAELPAYRFLDREDSWLRFAERVLELAEDEHVPLLERVRFVSIFASALDEFFMVRVAGRIRRMATGLPVESATGRPPREVLENTLELARGLSVRHARCFTEALVPALAREGIEVLRWKELSPQEQADMQSLFRERIYPVLTPLAVDPAHPFPFISGLSLSLAVTIADPRTGATIFARVKVPPLLPRFLTVARNRFVPLEDLIAAHLGELFVGLEVIEHYAFRVTRIRDLEIDEDVTEDLLQSLERELMRRRFEPAVRLEVEDSISDDVLDRLVTELGVDYRAVYRVTGPLDLSGVSVLADLDRPALKYPPFVPSETALPQDTSVFAALSDHDVLVHLPYDSFTASVQRLVVSAAADPRVLAIKHTLYRTSGDSEIVDALIDAAEAGKQVVVVVEIKARGDERANIGWARKLEEAGCHVVYGFVGLKTHCKMVLVVREEDGGSLRRFCHIGTGNYHPKTARLYEDFGLLTSDQTVGEDVTDLFNHLTGYSQKTDYGRLLVAPTGLRSGLLEQIEEQARRSRDGLPARIQMKCNAIIDEKIIDSLYRTSQAGVPIDLWVRGICSLRPGVPGLSETIRVRSVVGRFLEHSRIYAFGTGEEESPGDVWMGSADLMHRNLDRRVELLVRVTNPAHQAELRGLIDLAMDPSTASWWLAGDGTWTRHHLEASGAPLHDIQDLLVRARQARAANA